MSVPARVIVSQLPGLAVLIEAPDVVGSFLEMCCRLIYVVYVLFAVHRVAFVSSHLVLVIVRLIIRRLVMRQGRPYVLFVILLIAGIFLPWRT